MNNTNPTIWVHYYFDKGLPINNILQACHNPVERTKWDKDLEMAECFDVTDNNKVMLWHQKQKSSIKVVNQRDFLEKKVKFQADGKHYVFYSSVPDEIKPNEKNVSRGYSIIGFHQFENLPDGRVLCESIMQSDLNMGTGMSAKVALAAVMNMVPKMCKIWFQNLEEHVKPMDGSGSGTHK